jgi:hypothetical protein
VPPIGATPRFATTCRSPTLPKRAAQRLVAACPAVPHTVWLIEQVLVHHEGHSSPDCSRGMNGLFSVTSAVQSFGARDRTGRAEPDRGLQGLTREEKLTVTDLRDRP